jgi:Terminase large subunit, T4likevirus-type, N-terminal
MPTLEIRAARAEPRADARSSADQAEPIDHSVWEWFAESCPCGLPAGECRTHPRARASQRAPAGDWRVWAYVAGRGAGKTRAGACWIQQRVNIGTMKLGCLIAPTSADIRDVMVEGPSGLIVVAPSWCRPRFESSKRRVEWPNGARAVEMLRDPGAYRHLGRAAAAGIHRDYAIDVTLPRLARLFEEAVAAR